SSAQSTSKTSVTLSLVMPSQGLEHHHHHH
nr:Chain B, TGF-beta-activated kinase 1 and MAP3K7-binding protein 1 [Homo sapiens]